MAAKVPKLLVSSEMLQLPDHLDGGASRGLQ